MARGNMTSPEKIQELVAALAERARGIDIRPYEVEPLGCVVRDLVPSVTDVVADATRLLDEVLDLYEGHEGQEEAFADSGTFYEILDTMMASSEVERHVADLAFMGKLELRSKQEHLERIRAAVPEAGRPRARPWEVDPSERSSGRRGPDSSSSDPRFEEVIGLCSSCRRKLMKILTAVENAVAEDARLVPRLDFVSELSTSLQVRYAYTRMRRGFAGDGEPGEGEVRPRLVSAATAIARLIGRDVYSDLRFSDRMDLRRLQRRLLDWMSGDSPDEEGLRLWQDVAGFAELLTEVSQRSELVEHDRALVSRAYDELYLGPDQPGLVGDEIWSRLRNLYGRDRDVERLIERKDRDPESWRLPLARLRTHLAPAGDQAEEAEPTRDEPVKKNLAQSR